MIICSTDKLLEWKNNPRHKLLIVNGARQVGKTWLLNSDTSVINF